MVSIDNELSKERFGFTFFLSACVHAIIILGVGFTYLEELKSEPALEITIAQYRSELKSDEADFLAQENQIGSGILEEQAAPSTPFESDFNDDVIQEVVPVRSSPEIFNEFKLQDIALVSSIYSDAQMQNLLKELDTEGEKRIAEEVTPEDLSLEIASLQTQLDRQRQAYAKRPRRYTISSASTKKSHDALYLDNWRRRIEAVGNINYPDQARRQQIYGSLRMLVALLPDGQVVGIQILQSSKHSILDSAAIEIIHLAVPFDLFPQAMRPQLDILAITRSCRCPAGNSRSSI